MRPKVQWLCLVVLLFLAALQMSAAALWTPTSVAPDEDYHHKLVLNVAKQRNPPFWVPRDTPATASLGAVSRNPSLFHQVFGVVVAAKPHGVSTYAWLRAWNVLLSICSLVLVWKVALQASNGDARGAFVATILVSSIPMWLFLGGMVHYDNLTNLLSIVALGLTFAHVRAPSLASLLALVAVCAAGSLVKIVFLPLALVFLALGVVVFFLRVRKNMRALEPWPQAMGWPCTRRERLGVWVMGGVAACFAYASVQLYGTNFVRYGRFTPTCNQVLGTEVCEKHFTQFRVAQQREAQNAGTSRMPLPLFVAKYAGELDKQWDDIHGYVFLRVRTPVWRTVALWLAVVLGMVAAWRAGWRPWRDAIWGTAFLACLLYSLVLVAENWIGYLRHGSFGVAIHGRYIFPVVLALAVVALLPAFRAATSSRIRWLVLGLVAVSQLMRGPVDAWEGLHSKILTLAPGSPAQISP